MVSQVIIKHKQLTKRIVFLKDAAEWFTQQEFVDDRRVGTIGICFGGTLCLNLTANFSKVFWFINTH